MKRRDILKMAAALCAPGMGMSARAAASGSPLGLLPHLTTDPKAPLILYADQVSAQGMDALMTAAMSRLNWTPGRNTGVKMSFESASAPRLDVNLVRVVAERTKGTLIDCNGFTPPRDETQGHLELARRHGYADIAPIDILDAEGDMDLPVANGFRLKHARTGSHFARYDSVISLVRFKPHHLPRYGGTLKNLSICMGSLSGKAIIHSGGAIDTHYTSSDNRTTAEAMADAAKAALDAKPGRWAFVQVLAAVAPTDRCEEAEEMGDIGIFASLDPVALDQIAIDLAYGSSHAGEAAKRAWAQHHSTDLPALAERIGAGSTRYRLEAIG